MIQNLDFAPTFLDYAGITPSEDFQGISFKNIVNQKKLNGEMLFIIRIMNIHQFIWSKDIMV